ncbi:MAG TPA: class A beta-lactamase, partial [Brevundimonas sp.]|nr:class A beta-lactamase [Brevundimonas sp.]
GEPVVLAIYYHATRESSAEQNDAVVAEATRLALAALGRT